MRRRAFLTGLIVLALSTSHARAQSACDKPRNDFDGLYCLNKVYQQADGELNDAYGRLRPRLDASGQAALRSTQLAWLRTRNDTCSKREDTAFFVNLKCATDLTIARTQFLDDRYRECLGAGCVDGAIR